MTSTPLLRGLMKSALERMLNTEMDVHLGRKDPPPALRASRSQEPPQRTFPEDRQRRDGRDHARRPRDRNGTFEPQLIAKHQRRLAGFDEKILALYAKGMTTRDIQEVVKELYGVEVSPTLVSEITADLDAEVTAWRTRRLDAVWPIVYFDGIVVHVRGESGRCRQHTMYVAMGVNLQGRKELLGLWLSETEGAKFWLCVPDGPEEPRAVSDIFVACVDGLSGFPEAIRAAYPQTKVQLCIVHLVRAALKYVDGRGQPGGGGRPEDDLPGGDGRRRRKRRWRGSRRSGMASIRRSAKQWRLKWADIIALFEFPPAIRKAIYTTNAIEIGQQRDPQVHAQPQAVPQRGERVEAGVPGDPRGVEEVDDADRRLEGGPEPLRHPLRGPHAREAQRLTHLARSERP